MANKMDDLANFLLAQTGKASDVVKAQMLTAVSLHRFANAVERMEVFYRDYLTADKRDGATEESPRYSIGPVSGDGLKDALTRLVGAADHTSDLAVVLRRDGGDGVLLRSSIPRLVEAIQGVSKLLGWPEEKGTQSIKA